MTAKQLPLAGQEHQCCDHRRADGIVACPDCGAEVNSSGEPLTLEDRARHSLHSKKCPACNRRKKEEQSFCTVCYKAVHPALRSRLYLTFAEGYATWWKKCCEYLEAGEDQKKAGCA